MAVQVFKDELDKLLGINRNGDRPDAIITDFRDPRVCKSFLLGLCPHELFTNTKEDIGACTLTHDERLRKAYTEAAKLQDYGYDRELEHAMERLLTQAERTISKSRDRVVEEGGGAGGFIPSVDVEGAPELADITFTIEERVLAQAVAQDRGEFEKAGRIEEELETLRRSKSEQQARLLLSRATDEDRRATSANKQRLRVCNVCGAFVSLTDSQDRIADHFGGRAHLGFVAIRTKLANIRDWRRAMRACGGGGSGEAQAVSALASWAVQHPLPGGGAGTPEAMPLPPPAASAAASSSSSSYGGGYRAPVAFTPSGGGGGAYGGRSDGAFQPPAAASSASYNRGGGGSSFGGGGGGGYRDSYRGGPSGAAAESSYGDRRGDRDSGGGYSRGGGAERSYADRDGAGYSRGGGADRSYSDRDGGGGRRDDHYDRGAPASASAPRPRDDYYDRGAPPPPPRRDRSTSRDRGDYRARDGGGYGGGGYRR